MLTLKLPSPEAKAATHSGLNFGFELSTQGLVTGVIVEKSFFKSSVKPKFSDALSPTIFSIPLLVKCEGKGVPPFPTTGTASVAGRTPSYLFLIKFTASRR